MALSELMAEHAVTTCWVKKKKMWKMRKEQRKLLMWLMLSWLKALDGSIIIIVIIDVVVDILMSLGCTGE